MHTRELRFHHLFCVPLFEGKGYSDGFSENMQRIKDILFKDDPAVKLVCGCDCICENCPNKCEKGCSLDNENENRGVKIKDNTISALTGISVSTEIGFSEALERALKNISRDDFEEICGGCRWYKQGLCSYSLWKENVLTITNKHN